MNTTNSLQIPYVDPGDPQRDFPPLNKQAMEIIDAALFEQAGAIQDLDAAIGTTETALTTALAGKITGTGMTLRRDTTVGTRVLLDHPSGTTLLTGDTGWRNVSSSLLNGWSGTLHIRRENATILMRATALNGSSATSDTIYALPAGFIDTTWRDIPVYDAVDSKTIQMRMQPSEIKLPKRATPYFTPGYTEIVIARLDPARAWPTTYPGLPVS